MIPAKQFDLCPWGKLIAMPHMGWQHAGWFASYVVNAKNILEWGCGGSTLWMAMMNQAARITAIEHDGAWYERVSVACKALHDGGMSNHPDSLLLLGSGHAYVSGSTILAHAPYDLIFVDGHERPACLDVSYDLLAPGGVVFLHDSQRAEYTEAKRKLLEREGMTLIDERVDESWVNQKAGMWAAQKSANPAS